MGAFDTTVGVLLLGLFFNTFLYGFVCYQFLVYKSYKFNDPLWVRGIVGALFVTDTAHSLVVVYAAWEMCVKNYNNPSSLAVVSWTIPFTAVATSFTAIMTQFFLGHRVFKLTKSIPIVAVIGVFSFVGFVFGIYAGVRSGIIREVKYFDPLKPFVICWLGSQTCADLLITGVLAFVLAQSRTGFRKTDTVINRLICGAIQTGLFAALFALADLFSFLMHRNTTLYAMFCYPLGRIYTNTLLGTLNSRIELQIISLTGEESGGLQTGINTGEFRIQNQSQTIAEGVKTVDAKSVVYSV